MKSKKPRHENPAVPRRSCPVSRGTRLPSRRRRRHTSPPDVRGAPVRISTRARAMGPRDMTSLGGPRVDETAATADDGVFRGARVKARAAALDLLADAATLVTPLRGRPGGGASGDLDAATGGDVTASSWPSPSPARARARAAAAVASRRRARRGRGVAFSVGLAGGDFPRSRSRCRAPLAYRVRQRPPRARSHVRGGSTGRTRARASPSAEAPRGPARGETPREAAHATDERRERHLVRPRRVRDARASRGRGGEDEAQRCTRPHFRVAAAALRVRAMGAGRGRRANASTTAPVVVPASSEPRLR